MLPTAPARRRTARRAALTALATAAAVAFGPAQLAGAVGAPAAADQTPTLASLKADVARTADRLEAATVALHRGQAELGALVQRKVSSSRNADQLAVEVVTARQRMSATAARLYRNPVDPMISAVLTGNAHAIADVLALKRMLGDTNRDRQQDLELLTTEAKQAQQLTRTQDEAATAAIRLQSRLEQDLVRIQADAKASLERLQTTVEEIRRRELVAAFEAAERSRARAQRAAAATAAAAAAAAAAPAGSGLAVLGAPSPGSCTGRVPADAINGFLPPSSLCPVRSARGHRLIAPAAAAFDQMSAAFAADFGTPICVTDSYRDYATQVRLFRTKPNLAATPGRSQHGWGRAVDLCGGIQSFGTAPYYWMKRNAASFGFIHPAWAEPNGSRPEPWHWEFRG